MTIELRRRMMPVTDGLPDDDITVFCRNEETDEWWLGYLSCTRWLHYESDEEIPVTHWMELPEV